MYRFRNIVKKLVLISSFMLCSFSFARLELASASFVGQIELPNFLDCDGELITTPLSGFQLLDPEFYYGSTRNSAHVSVDTCPPGPCMSSLGEGVVSKDLSISAGVILEKWEKYSGFKTIGYERDYQIRGYGAVTFTAPPASGGKTYLLSFRYESTIKSKKFERRPYSLSLGILDFGFAPVSDVECIEWKPDW